MYITNMNSVNDSQSGADIYAIECMCDNAGLLNAPLHDE